jgi:hypothetical protein
MMMTNHQVKLASCWEGSAPYSVPNGQNESPTCCVSPRAVKFEKKAADNASMHEKNLTYRK